MVIHFTHSKKIRYENDSTWESGRFASQQYNGMEDKVNTMYIPLTSMLLVYNCVTEK